MLRNDAQNTDKENNNKSNNSQINTLTSDPIILICLSIFPGTTAPSAKRTCDTKIIKRHGKIQAVRSDGLFFFTAKYKANCAAYLAHVTHRGNASKKNRHRNTRTTNTRKDFYTEYLVKYIVCANVCVCVKHAFVFVTHVLSQYCFSALPPELRTMPNLLLTCPQLMPTAF